MSRRYHHKRNYKSYHKPEQSTSRKAAGLAWRIIKGSASILSRDVDNASKEWDKESRHIGRDDERDEDYHINEDGEIESPYHPPSQREWMESMKSGLVKFPPTNWDGSSRRRGRR
jgi:hypothetical protein